MIYNKLKLILIKSPRICHLSGACVLIDIYISTANRYNLVTYRYITNYF